MRSRGLALRPVLILAAVLDAGVACAQGPESRWAKEAAEMLPALERLSNLKAKERPVVRETDARGLRAYLVERLEETFPGDLLERTAAAYRWLGLLPDTLEIRSLLLRLYEEQAIGFYDPKRDVLYVRGDAPAAALSSVLAHELVHALQDQHVDLEPLITDWRDNDRHTAVQAAIEGHATLAMAAWQMEASAGSPLDFAALRDLGAWLEQSTAEAAGRMPVYAAAPRLLREALVFPYTRGTDYVQGLWQRHAERPPPLGGYLPASTEQVLHGLDAGPPTAVRWTGAPPGWTVEHQNNLGEFEIGVFLGTHLGEGPARERAAQGWDGDRYAILTRVGSADTAFAWLTVWDSEADAAEFERAYRRAFAARFGGPAVGERGLVGPGAWARVDALEVGGRPARRVVEARRALAPAFFRGLRFEAERGAGSEKL